MKLLAIIIAICLFIFSYIVIQEGDSSSQVENLALRPNSIPLGNTNIEPSPTRTYPTFTPMPTTTWRNGQRIPTRDELLQSWYEALLKEDYELAENTEKVMYMIYPNYFHGYKCETDCSGHEAGYNWASTNNIEDEYYCSNESESFEEGCRIFVEELEEYRVWNSEY